MADTKNTSDNAHSKRLLALYNCSEAQVAHAAVHGKPVMVEPRQEVSDEIFTYFVRITDYTRSIIDLAVVRNETDNWESGQHSDEVVAKDRIRTACHDDVIGQAHVINRICVYLNLPEVMSEIDQMSRKEIAMAAFDILSDMTKELY
ncbi:MAG: hypothetical protein PUE64_10290 [Firmicutes bacterium]|jgi:hypothetical protein|nr:hypothetical protein [Bacillota bacterium]